MSFEGIYVLGRSCSVGENVLFEVMCWCGACLYDGISCYLFGLVGSHFLLDDMICSRVRIVGEYEYEFILILTLLFNW